jgi:VIT1/CCC1 family predicted Fe2+/Mn2+ transporter
MGGDKMSFIDVAIPALIGLAALVWPQVMFYGSRVTPDEKKIRLIRGGGVLLLVAAAIYLVIKLAGE